MSSVAKAIFCGKVILKITPLQKIAKSRGILVPVPQQQQAIYRYLPAGASAPKFGEPSGPEGSRGCDRARAAGALPVRATGTIVRSPRGPRVYYGIL